MADFSYKRYTKEEEALYMGSMERLRRLWSQGVKYAEICASIDVKDEELKSLIGEDFLKILIVELHYEKAYQLKDVASMLGLPYERILEAKNSMLEDVQHTAVAEYHKATSRGEA